MSGKEQTTGHRQSRLAPSAHSPEEEGGGVQHAVEGSQVIGPLASLLHPEEHVFAQALELRQLLPQLLGGGGVAILIHPFRCFFEFAGDLFFLLLRYNQQVFVLVNLVLKQGPESGLRHMRKEKY